MAGTIMGSVVTGQHLAVPVVEAMMNTHPENPIGMQMMNYIRQQSGG